MRRLFLLLVVSVFSLCALISCHEETGTGTLKVMMHCDISKILDSGNSALDVVKYTVSGTGPGGKSFCVDSTSSTVTLEGIVHGDWSLTAVAFNMNSKAIAQGTANVSFEYSSQSVSLNLSELQGYGSLQIKYLWEEEVQNPILSFTLLSLDFTVLQSKTINVEAGRSYHTVSVSQLPVGIYLVKATLSNGDVKVGGTIEAVRIVSSDKTSGTVEFYKTDSNSSDGTVAFIGKNKSKLAGHIDGISSQVSAGEDLNVSFQTDGSSESFSGFSFRWFLDGELLDCNNEDVNSEVKFKVNKGEHILCFLTINSSFDTCGIGVIRFEAKIDAKKGVPVFTSVEESGNTLKIGNESSVCAIPNNRILVLTPTECSFQLCKVFNNRLVVLNTYTGAMEGFSWVSNGRALYSNTSMNIFASVYGESNINFYLYSAENETIEPALYDGKQEKYESEEPTMHIPIGKIDFIHCMNNSCGGTFFICDSNKQTLVYPTSKDNRTITNKGVGLKPEDLKTLSSMDVYSSLVVAVAENNSQVFFSNFSDGSIQPIWDSFTTRIDSPEQICLLNSENILICGNGILCKYIKYSSSGWTWQQTLDVEVCLLEKSSDSSFLYVVDSENRLITYSASTGRLIKLSSYQIEEKVKQLVVNDLNLFVLSQSGKIYLFTISQEEK